MTLAQGCRLWGLGTLEGRKKSQTLSLIESRGLGVGMEGRQVSRVAMEEIVR